MDEGLILLFTAGVVCRVTARKRSFRPLPGSFAFVIFIALGLLSAYLADVELTIAAQDTFLLTKGLLLCWAFLQVDWTRRDIRTLSRFGAMLFTLVLLSGALSILFSGAWSAQFAVTGIQSSRGGISVPTGIFGHPGWFGQVTALGAIAIYCYRKSYPQTRAGLVLLVATTVATVLTLRRKAIFALVASLLTVSALENRQVKSTTRSLIALLTIAALVLGWPILAAVVSDTYAQYLDPNRPDSARTELYLASIEVAKSTFPFGSGFGSFGTATAFEHYSSLYYSLGLSSIYGLEPVTGSFATDTFWPAILAQTGALGFVAFLLGLLKLTSPALYLFKETNGAEHHHAYRFVSLVAIGWSVEFLFESLAAPVYSAPPVYPLLFLSLAVASKLRDEITAPKKPSSP